MDDVQRKFFWAEVGCGDGYLGWITLDEISKGRHTNRKKTKRPARA